MTDLGESSVKRLEAADRWELEIGGEMEMEKGRSSSKRNAAAPTAVVAMDEMRSERESGLLHFEDEDFYYWLCKCVM